MLIALVHWQCNLRIYKWDCPFSRDSNSCLQHHLHALTILHATTAPQWRWCTTVVQYHFKPSSVLLILHLYINGLQVAMVCRSSYVLCYFINMVKQKRCDLLHSSLMEEKCMLVYQQRDFDFFVKLNYHRWSSHDAFPARWLPQPLWHYAAACLC